MKTCLIAGGAGFIGSHLIKELLSGYKIICVDDLSTGSLDNIKPILDNKNLKFINHDIRNPLKINDDIYCVFNLASMPSPVDFIKNPIDILMINSLGTYNMLKLAKEKGSKFILASSSEVYGDPLEHPQREDYWGNVNPIGKRSCYDEGKRFSESLSVSFKREFNLPVKIIRIFNTYGPYMRKDDGRVIPNFILQCIKKEAITVYGSGKQTRSFCYINDLVEGIKKIMLDDSKEIIFNLGNDKEISIIELANILKELTGSSSEIVFKKLPENDPKRRKPDISKSKRILNWKPETLLKDGLKKTIEYFESL